MLFIFISKIHFIQFSDLSVGLSSPLCSSEFPAKTLRAFLSPTCILHTSPLLILLLLDDEYSLWSVTPNSLLHPPTTSSPLEMNILLCSFFSLQFEIRWKWSVSFSLGERASGSRCVGCSLGPRTCSDTVEKIRILFCWESNTGHIVRGMSLYWPGYPDSQASRKESKKLKSLQKNRRWTSHPNSQRMLLYFPKVLILGVCILLRLWDHGWRVSVYATIL
jgi:hypothetical protein